MPIGELVIVCAAGAIWYLSDRRTSRVMEDMQQTYTQKDVDPPQEPYEELQSPNKYVYDMMSGGYQPIQKMGDKGMPIYLYPKPGGKAFWFVRNPSSFID